MDSLRWEWYGLVLLTLGQIILVLRAPLTGLSDRIWQAWLVGNPALCLAIVTWRPDAWRRHRVWMVPLLRIVTHLVPQQRSSQAGAARCMAHFTGRACAGGGGCCADGPSHARSPVPCQLACWCA